MVNTANLYRATQLETITGFEKASVLRYPKPQYFVAAAQTAWNPTQGRRFLKKSLRQPTNAARSPCCFPLQALATKSRSLCPKELTLGSAARTVFLIAASLNADIFDFVLRQKLQRQTNNIFNLFLPEQLPAIAPARFNDPLPAASTQAMCAASLMNGRRANPTVPDVVTPQRLTLSYTVHEHRTVRA